MEEARLLFPAALRQVALQATTVTKTFPPAVEAAEAAAAVRQ